MSDFSHIDKTGMPAMVDVSEKKISQRSATARAIVVLPKEIIDKLNGEDMVTKKGSVFQTATIAGIMAAKKTGDLIPLCHPLGLNNCVININIDRENELIIECTAEIEARTGVEMEALVAVSVAALTIYDMCKAVDKGIEIREIVLQRKSGGKSSEYVRQK